eukprot:1300390-Amphidinium_carterae.2
MIMCLLLVDATASVPLSVICSFRHQVRMKTKAPLPPTFYIAAALSLALMGHGAGRRQELPQN